MGSEQGDMIRNIVGSFNIDGTRVDRAAALTGAFFDAGGNMPAAAHQAQTGNYSPNIGFDLSRVVPTGLENTVKNRASLGLIKVS